MFKCQGRILKIWDSNFVEPVIVRPLIFDICNFFQTLCLMNFHLMFGEWTFNTSWPKLKFNNVIQIDMTNRANHRQFLPVVKLVCKKLCKKTAALRDAIFKLLKILEEDNFWPLQHPQPTVGLIMTKGIYKNQLCYIRYMFDLHWSEENR